MRRAETTVELGSGQSFAIAGLLQDNSPARRQRPADARRDRRSSAPCSAPTSFQRNETELVIIVTPYIVRPVADAAALRLPTDGWQAPSDDLNASCCCARPAPPATRAASPPPHIPGNAGFIVQ